MTAYDGFAEHGAEHQQVAQPVRGALGDAAGVAARLRRATGCARPSSAMPSRGTRNGGPDARRDALAQERPAEQRHDGGNGRHDHARRHGAGQAHAEQHADREQEIAQEGFEEQQSFRARGHRRFVRRFAQPVQHGQPADAKAQPGQQEHGNRRDQWLGQGDIAADQRHAQCEAGIGEQAIGARAHSEWLFFARRTDDARSPAAPRFCLRHAAPRRAQRHQRARARAALCRHGRSQGHAVPPGLVSRPHVGRRRGRHRGGRGLRNRRPRSKPCWIASSRSSRARRASISSANWPWRWQAGSCSAWSTRSIASACGASSRSATATGFVSTVRKFSFAS